MEKIKSNALQLWVIAILILITVNIFTWISYQKTKLAVIRVQEENKTLRLALEKPATEIKPKVEIRTETKVVNLSAEQRAELEKKYGDQVADLISQINAMQTIITTWSYDGGSTVSPQLPRPPVPPTNQILPNTQTNIVRGRWIIGIDYLSDSDLQLIAGWQPSKKLDVSIIALYSRYNKYGIGALVRF
jgi:hypothetical protein